MQLAHSCQSHLAIADGCPRRRSGRWLSWQKQGKSTQRVPQRALRAHGSCRCRPHATRLSRWCSGQAPTCSCSGARRLMLPSRAVRLTAGGSCVRKGRAAVVADIHGGKPGVCVQVGSVAGARGCGGRTGDVRQGNAHGAAAGGARADGVAQTHRRGDCTSGSTTAPNGGACARSTRRNIIVPCFFSSSLYSSCPFPSASMESAVSSTPSYSSSRSSISQSLAVPSAFLRNLS